MLQEQNAEPGDHIVRARGAWFGNRSISAEVDLDVGIYEVLPKIEASRDGDAPDVHDVVTKVAERNPQKLRQIGLNYDIANAKGFDEPTEEEKKEKERKKKDAADKKKKKLEEEAKDKADFEAWKREEKAEYEAWKKEKEREKGKGKTTSKEGDTKDDTKESEAKKEDLPVATEVKDDKPEKNEQSTPVEPPAAKDESASPSTAVEQKGEAKVDTTEAKEDNDTKTKPSDGADASDDEAPQHTPEDEAPPQHPLPPASMIDGPLPYRPMYGRHPDSVYGDVPPPPPPPQQVSGPPADNSPKPWNAVCVLGLRVYSQDPEVSIKLIKPKDAEEGALLDVDGDTAAGATM